MVQNYTLEDVSNLLNARYGLKGKLKELGSYADRNFLLQTEAAGHKSTRYIVKISLQVHDQRILLLQNEVLRELTHHKHEFQCEFPQITPTKQKEDMIVLASQNGKDFLRVLSFIEGEEIYELEDPPLHLFDQAGELAAKMSLFLGKLSVKKQVVELYTSIKPDNNSFNLLQFNKHYQQKKKFLDPNVVPIVDKIREEFNEVFSTVQSLSKQLVHHDICLTNLLVAKRPQTEEYFISGLIDFSDLFETHAIIELVILAARINLYEPEPLRNALRVITAFNRVKKLSEDQKRVLFPLVKARLALLAMTSSQLAAEKADDPYFKRCKSGHLSYLVTFANACTNHEFLSRLNCSIQKDL